ncbi:hypothetical protein [uncultured Croceitalea sp.]|uniref:hypothetical protein n=1 Tax=uncultured Croceitalea sp. TaxID=1798908 RepID=UPI00374F6829
MKDIFKSGLLGLALIGTLVLASINTNEIENHNSEYNDSKTEEIVVEDNNILEKDKLTNKDNFHTPL